MSVPLKSRTSWKISENLLLQCLERSLKNVLGCSSVRATTVFNPNLKAKSFSKQQLIDCLEVLLKHFMTLNIWSATQYDQVLADFSTFYQNELKHAKVNGRKFKKDKDRLDNCYVKELFCFKEFSFVLKVILTMSHGQVAAERGFNINNSAR